MSKKIRDFRERNKHNLAKGALVRAHIREGDSMKIKKAFVVTSNITEQERQLDLFPRTLIYLLHSSTMLHVYDSQILEVLSFPV